MVFFFFANIIGMVNRFVLCFILGIYEIFSREVFGVKVKNLEFGLQPHKIPDTETVSHQSGSQMCNVSHSFPFLFVLFFVFQATRKIPLCFIE